ncbi:dsDNA nuclease domain-containing protein [Rhizobium tubonense]|uniref:dsDNA nuclease domain-containing protein n=1 Tax=Rhizobium tubonense TaxID=484088 RepID=UPI0018A7E8CB|nr:dsDNA nuclease domain-containing protein [Rhizobium tubonense]
MLNACPSVLLDLEDPGDDVIARFRYQFSHVAIQALKMVVDPQWAKAIICENFEDFIVERHTGTFSAIQVKSRERHLSPFKLNELAVEKAIVRFVRLDLRFPGIFDEFVFVTNHEMWIEKENESNLVWLLDEIERQPTIKRLRATNPKKIAIDRLCKASGADADSVIATLSRTRCNPQKQDIKTIDRAVEHAIVECEQCSDLQHRTVLRLVDDLVAAAFHASSKGRNTFVPSLYAADVDYASVFQKAALQGKMLGREMVQAIIADRLKPVDEPLAITDLLEHSDLPVGLSRMVQKMAAGGVQLARINHVQDLVRSFEALKVRWATRYGGDKAKEMVNDLLARTLTECVEAHVEAEAAASGMSYGSSQFSLMKAKLEARYTREQATLYGCKPDHLIGAAGLLTEYCKVWWSSPFELLAEA